MSLLYRNSYTIMNPPMYDSISVRNASDVNSRVHCVCTCVMCVHGISLRVERARRVCLVGLGESLTHTHAGSWRPGPSHKLYNLLCARALPACVCVPLSQRKVTSARLIKHSTRGCALLSLAADWRLSDLNIRIIIPLLSL